jgi:hypothetical protein
MTDRSSVRFISVAGLVMAVTIACGGESPGNASRDATAGAPGETATEVPRQSRVTGCLQRGTIPGTFVLADVEPTVVGTSGSRENQVLGAYPLVNKGDTDLTNYVGARVTVSGRFQAETDAPAADRAPGVAERTGAAPDVRELIVEEVERAGGACQDASK